MSFSLGRPFTLDASEITVPWPSPRDRREENASQHQIFNSGGPSLEQTDFAALIMKKRILLCDIVEPIARAL